MSAPTTSGAKRGELTQIVPGAAGQLEHAGGAVPMSFGQRQTRQERGVRPAVREVGANRAKRQGVHRSAEGEALRPPRQRDPVVLQGRGGARPVILVAQQQHQRPLRVVRIERRERRLGQAAAVGAQERDVRHDRPTLWTGGKGVRRVCGQRPAGDRAGQCAVRPSHHGRPASRSTA